MEYVLLLEDRAFGYQSGFLPEAAHAPGRTVMCSSILTALDEGRRLYDFLRGDEAYKAEYATAHHDDVRIQAVRVSPATAGWAARILLRKLASASRRGAGGRG
jgi:CelD/BcsL family acetyltransferase involved in cellulose biosynthesis